MMNHLRYWKYGLLPLHKAIATTFNFPPGTLQGLVVWESQAVQILRFPDPTGKFWKDAVDSLRLSCQSNFFRFRPANFDPENKFSEFINEWRFLVLTALNQPAHNFFRNIGSSSVVIPPLPIKPTSFQRSAQVQPSVQVIPAFKQASEQSLHTKTVSKENDAHTIFEIENQLRSCQISQPKDVSVCLIGWVSSSSESDEMDMSPDFASVLENHSTKLSLTELLLDQLNLKAQCEAELEQFEDDLVEKIEHGLSLGEIKTILKDFCRRNSGPGFYDQHGRFEKLVSTWYDFVFESALPQVDLSFLDEMDWYHNRPRANFVEKESFDPSIVKRGRFVYPIVL